MKNYMEHQVKSTTEKILKKIVKVFFVGILIIAFLLAFGYGFMWLWNWLMPDIFGLTVISYWQAVGILVLAKILFGGFGNSGSGKKGKNKGKRCKSPDKLKFGRDFSKWKHYESFWEEEGEKAYNDYVSRKMGQTGDQGQPRQQC
ncbi:magnesium transporter [Pseudozobellia thermophila]|uniref:Uncharacterized protein n=1 Tax=Pseudozobellia thermophila TaxID=192903 RepID=A0A1M6C6H1_9FLAO|nr:magnesium transporter [Pseudozobellia thermophila]SHI56615.1 hypothetical protein SAMN04488513_101659 [Pseudozobellia thermophila]